MPELPVWAKYEQMSANLDNVRQNLHHNLDGWRQRFRQLQIEWPKAPTEGGALLWALPLTTNPNMLTIGGHSVDSDGTVRAQELLAQSTQNGIFD